nr:Sec-independent protein translocase subunit TatA [Actinomycetota bacterium]
MWRDLAQPSHLIIIAVLLLILFGWKRLPDAARSVGRSMRIFKSEVSEMKNDGKEGRPSPAANDTVPGDVVPPPAAQPAPQY